MNNVRINVMCVLYKLYELFKYINNLQIFI